MKAVGITAEYNPFHNGHIYHAETARQMSGADCVIAVMSGDFTQRGEMAVRGKWERAEDAVKSGAVDLVIELPFAFACSKASVFAAGAVDMLASIGADGISFGCEAEDPALLRKLAETLFTEAEMIEAARSSLMRDGYSSAKAYELAVARECGEEAAMLLREPNNILAVEYLKRIMMLQEEGSDLRAFPVKRHGSGYTEESEETSFAGAGALRRMIREGSDIRRYIPGSPDFADLKRMEEQYLQMLKGIVLRSGPEEIRSMYGVGEGMEHGIIRETRRATDLNELISALTSRRYTGATVRRALTHILAGSGWEEIDRLTARVPEAGRLLAAGKRGRAYMRQLPDDGFRIITNINKEEGNLDPETAEFLRLDEKTADLYHLLCGEDIYSASDRVRRPYIE